MSLCLELGLVFCVAVPLTARGKRTGKLTVACTCIVVEFGFQLQHCVHRLWFIGTLQRDVCTCLSAQTSVLFVNFKQNKKKKKNNNSDTFYFTLKSSWICIR